MKRCTVALAALLVCTLCTPSSGAMVAAVTGPDDTQCAMILGPDSLGIYTGHENWGGRSFANVYEQEYGMNTSAHMLLRFDLPSLSLNTPDDILSATLTLHRNDYLSNEGVLRLYRLVESWEEGTGSGASAVYASETGGTGGTAYGPQDGACDWFDRYHGSTAWTAPGALGPGSSLDTPSAVYTVAGEYTVSIDVTDDVRYWYANGTNLMNCGWVMTSRDTDGRWRVGIRFGSDDTTAPGRPSLAIEYVPEPSAFVVWSLLGALGITVGWFRRRRAA